MTTSNANNRFAGVLSLLGGVFVIAGALTLPGCPGPGGTGVGIPLTCAQNPNQPQCVDATTQPDTPGQDVPGQDAQAETSTDTPGPDGTCTPDCAGKACGADGCGGFCGSCGTGFTCDAGQCVEGECGQGGATVSGELKVGGGIEFDKVTVSVAHKMDIDEFEDGCLTTVIIDVGKGFGCTLRVEAGTATWPTGGLRITNLEFFADSQCPGFPDESEGEYTDFSGLTLAAVLPGVSKVPDANAPESCLTTNFEVKLEGTLRAAGDKVLNVAPTTITVGGEFKSIGSTTASCPCAASCGGKECGDDGCGFECGTCADNELCGAGGQCECIPDCSGKVCGDDGCGGECGTCGEFEGCVDFQCVACTPQCDGKVCGDDQCGGTCGDCAGGESCDAAGQCVCDNTTCGGVCCDAGQVCDGGDACCAPQCDGKECGNDGCGGSCGSCSGNAVCDGAGQCICTPDCSGKVCGDDGCGGSCGTCSGGQTCNAAGQCQGCFPDCSGKVCGADGCGGSCGSCAGGQTCNASGQCDSVTCTPDDFSVVAANFSDQGGFTLTNMFNGDPQTTTPFDILRFEVWANPADLTIPGAYDLSTWDNFGTCALCTLFQANCDINADPLCTTFYYATSGFVQIESYDPTTGIQLAFFDLVVQEVTLDDQAMSTPVPGGDTLCIPDTGGFNIPAQ